MATVYATLYIQSESREKYEFAMIVDYQLLLLAAGNNIITLILSVLPGEIIKRCFYIKYTHIKLTDRVYTFFVRVIITL